MFLLVECTGGHSGSVLPRPGHSGARHSTQSYNMWQEDTFFPHLCVSAAPHHNVCTNVRQRPPHHCKLGWTVAEHRAVCLCHRQVKRVLCPIPMLCHLTSGQPKASPQLQHGTHWSSAMSRHYWRQADTQTTFSTGQRLVLSVKKHQKLAPACHGQQRDAGSPWSSLAAASYLCMTPKAAPEGRGCVCCAGTGAQTQVCLVQCPFPEVWALPAWMFAQGVDAVHHSEEVW